MVETLYYFIKLGKGTLDEIEVEGTTTIGKLREKIYGDQKGIFDRHNLAKGDLELYAPSGLELDSEESLLERADIQDLPRLRIWQTVKEVVNNGLGQKSVHIIIVPRTGEPTLGGSGTLGADSRKRPRPSSPDDVETRRGWEVEGQQMWHSFYAYWRTQNFEETFGQSRLSLALDALGSTDISHRLPYLGASSRSFHVAGSYRTLFDRVLNYKQSSPSCGVLVTGQPGTGKTTWLWFVLICLITKGESVAFYSGDQTRFFHQNCVYRIGMFPDADHPRTSTGAPVWCLIDSDFTPSPPPGYLVKTTTDIFPIQASSPNHGRYHTWIKQRRGVTWGMPLWSQEDLMDGLELYEDVNKLKDQLESGRDAFLSAATPILRGAYLTVEERNSSANVCSQDVLRDALYLAMHSYGEAPRDVYDGIFKPHILEGNIDRALEGISYAQLLEAMRAVATSSVMDAQLVPPHRLIAIGVKSGPATEHDSFVPKFRSASIGERVIEKFGHLQYQQARDLFNVYRALPEFASAACWILEGVAHGVLSGKIYPECTFSLVTMAASKTPRNFSTLLDAPRIAELRLHPREHTLVRFTDNELKWPPSSGFRHPFENCFCVPASMNNPLFDSFFVEYTWVEDRLNVVVWIFQKTVSKHHDGSAKGYPLIRSIKHTAMRRAEEIVDHAKTSTTVDRPMDVSMELKYILLCPGPEEKRSWLMPEGWTNSVMGDVFCLFIDVEDAVATP